MNLHQRFGWYMFTLSGVLILWTGIRGRDWLTVVSAVAWIAGCIAFIIAPDN